MKEKIENSKLDYLEIRASKFLEIKEIYYKKDYYDDLIKYLRNQKKLPFINIKKILKLSRLNKYPIGTILICKNSKKIVGFVGTYFSQNFLNKNEKIFCNIHSWIVDQKFRIYSFFLISHLLKKKINLTAFTPVQSLKGLLLKLGFKKEIFIENFCFNLSLYFNLNKKVEFLENSEKSSTYLDQKNREIYNYCSNDIFLRFIFKTNSNKKLLVIATCTYKKKLKVLKFLYISNYSTFFENQRYIFNIITKKFKIFIFSEYLYEDNQDSMFIDKLFKIKRIRDIYTKSSNKIGFYQILNSDLLL